MENSSFPKTVLPLLILAVYALALWMAMTPAWKRQLLQARVMGMVRPQPLVSHLLSVADELEIRRFRNLISRWDHDQVGTRDKRQSGDQS